MKGDGDGKDDQGVHRGRAEDEPRTMGRYGLGLQGIREFFTECYDGFDVDIDDVMDRFWDEIIEHRNEFTLFLSDLDPDWLEDFLRRF